MIDVYFIVFIQNCTSNDSCKFSFNVFNLSLCWFVCLLVLQFYDFSALIVQWCSECVHIICASLPIFMFVAQFNSVPYKLHMWFSLPDLIMRLCIKQCKL